MELSAEARSVWAKSVDETGGWLPLWQHMDDSAEIAGGLFDHWLAPSVTQLFATEFDGSRDQARAAIRFLAGVHDLGKATPAFAVQCTLLAQRMCDQGLFLPLSKADLPDRKKTHHSIAGHHLLVRWLAENNWTKPAARSWGVVLGGHHGVPPDAVAEQEASPIGLPVLYGKGIWSDVHSELIEWMAARSGAAEYLALWAGRKLTTRFQVLATAVVIIADWIASNSDLLPFHRDRLPAVADSSNRVRQALTTLRLPEPWRPAQVTVDATRMFATRFRLPTGARPRSVQKATYEIAKAMSEPGLLIVEAPMGEGKTEAALVAVEIMASRWGADGVLVALPTQATTDAMFSRMVSWLDALGAEDQRVGGSIVLGHGKAKLNRVFQGLVRAGRLAEIGCDGEKSNQVTAHGWLSGRKKALLANFAVVTIDQLLFAGLKARHLMLRHLALAGKVVVIDEIHAYDAYMNSYLTKVLAWLGEYRVPVVALSATLPSEQRKALVRAYQQGSTQAADVSALDGNIGYPVLTWTAGTSVSKRVTESTGRELDVQVEQFQSGIDDLDELASMLWNMLDSGGTALIVRNSVRRVLETAKHLIEVFPGEVDVTHSRFIAADRVRKDTELLDHYGSPDRAVRRPGRRIVVASQVVEQSLDIDFDLVVTDLAPADLLLQRIGRLHRHQRGDNQQQRPEKLRQARMFLTGANFGADPPELEPAAERHVYDAHTLYRAAAVFRGRTRIQLPGDIAPLVQLAYGPDDLGPESWREAMTAAAKKRCDRTERRESKAEEYQIVTPAELGSLISGWVSGNVGDADEDTAEGRGQVRDGAPSLEAILVCEDDTGGWRTPAWLEDGHGDLPVPKTSTPAEDIAEVLASCVIRLPLTFSNAATEEELWDTTPPAWEDSPLIYRQPVLRVDEHGRGQLNRRGIHYTPEFGLEVSADEQ